MRKRLVSGMATLVVAGVLVVPALAASPNAAQKEPLIRSAGSCLGHTGTPTSSFAVIKQNGNGTISAAISLANAIPNATYTVELIQLPSVSGCNVPVGTLQTDALGDGDGNFSVPAVTGTTSANVVLFFGDDAWQSVNAVFPSK